MASERPRVLLFDADPETARLLGPSFDKAGYLLEALAEETELPARLESFHPDVLVIGLQQEEREGFDLLARHADALRRLDVSTVLVVSPTTGIETICQGLDLGVEEYLFQPLQGEVVAARLGVVIRRRKLVFERIQRSRLEGMREISAGLASQLVVWTAQIEKHSRELKEEILPIAPGHNEINDALLHIEAIQEVLGGVRETATFVRRIVGAIPDGPARVSLGAPEPSADSTLRRRSGPRVAPSALVTVAHGGHRFNSLAFSMNERGMFLASPLQVPPVGARLRIEVHASGSDPIPPLDALVVSVRTADTAGLDPHPVGVGIRFENLSVEALEAVRAYLCKLGGT